MVWARQSINEASIGATGAYVDLLELFRGTMGITANLPGITIMRVRGDLQFQHGGNPLITTTGMVVGVKKDQIGADPVPAQGSPIDFPHDDWMFHQFVPVANGTTQAGSAAPLLQYSLSLDVKSKRRLDEPQESLWLCLDITDTRTDGFGVAFGWISTLIALP